MATKVISFTDGQGWNTSFLSKTLDCYSHIHLTSEKCFPNYSILQSAKYSGEVKYSVSTGTVTDSSARIYISSESDDETYSDSEYYTDPITISTEYTKIETGDISSYLFKNSAYNEDLYLHIRVFVRFSSSKTSRMTVDHKNRNVEITYAPPTVTVNAETNGAGGTVAGGKTLTLAQADTEYSATLTATPRAGYKFVRWSDGNTSPSRTVTYSDNNIAAHETTVTYTAIFEQNETPPEITSAELIYSDRQVTAQNKVPAGQSFIIRVEAK